MTRVLTIPHSTASLKGVLKLWALAGIISVSVLSHAHATFSIVAVDTLTGAVGGAGASCIAGSNIINRIIESVGAVHAQAFWIRENMDNMEQRLAEGLTPDSIIAWMVANDVQGTPSFRQYLAVTLAGSGVSAGFTGFDASNFKGNRFAATYSIAGNILNDTIVLDDMKTAYLATSGPLEEKLMAALQGAKRVGADLRCTNSGRSSISAFIKVTYPGDGSPRLYLNVQTTPSGTEPIDVLQGMFDDWKLAQQANADLSTVTPSVDSIPASGTASTILTITPLNQNSETPTLGLVVSAANTGAGTLSAVTDNGDGTYEVTLTSATVRGDDVVQVSVDAGGVVTQLTQQPAVFYFRCGDPNNDGNVNISDITYLIARIFAGGASPLPELSGDANGSGGVNISDITYLIARIFAGGAAPVCPS
ncbi:MAG: DUF1028 domain-containing protein [candidate division Zixibacteria bacterium]|nr:DUF1028 domain-containing protein [candidate division Zixibacteria bacterium]